jgi:hypothetical protein
MKKAVMAAIEEWMLMQTKADSTSRQTAARESA